MTEASQFCVPRRRAKTADKVVAVLATGAQGRDEIIAIGQ